MRRSGAGTPAGRLARGLAAELRHGDAADGRPVEVLRGDLLEVARAEVGPLLAGAHEQLLDALMVLVVPCLAGARRRHGVPEFIDHVAHRPIIGDPASRCQVMQPPVTPEINMTHRHDVRSCYTVMTVFARRAGRAGAGRNGDAPSDRRRPRRRIPDDPLTA